MMVRLRCTQATSLIYFNILMYDNYGDVEYGLVTLLILVGIRRGENNLLTWREHYKLSVSSTKIGFICGIICF